MSGPLTEVKVLPGGRMALQRCWSWVRDSPTVGYKRLAWSKISCTGRLWDLAGWYTPGCPEALIQWVRPSGRKPTSHRRMFLGGSCFKSSGQRGCRTLQVQNSHRTVALPLMVQTGVDLHLTVRMLERGPELVGALQIGVSSVRVRPQHHCSLTGEEGDEKCDAASA